MRRRVERPSAGTRRAAVARTPILRDFLIETASARRVTTAQVAAFISGQVASRGLAPKTANRYREILTRLFNWAMTQHGVKMPEDKNPAAKVERYRER